MPLHRRNVDDPVMSDLTILVSVEDLINIAMGPTEGNTINYKMIQTVLHILARHLRLLETKVDLKIADATESRTKKKKKKDSYSDSPSSDTSPKRDHLDDIEEDKPQEKGGKKRRKSTKVADSKQTEGTIDKSSKEKYRDKEKDMSAKDRDSDVKEENIEANEREKMDKMPPKEREKYMKEKEKQKKSKEQISENQDEGDDKGQVKKKMKSIKEKEQKVLEKMSHAEKQAYNKQKEKEAKIMENMSPKDKEKYLKEKEKELNTLLEMSPAEMEKHFKQKEENSFQEKEKEQEIRNEKEKMLLEKMSPNEKTMYLKQKEREDKALEKMSPKEKEKYLKEKEKEYRVLEKMSPKEREKYLQEKEAEAIVIEKITPKEREKYLNEKNKKASKASGSGTSIAITEVERQHEKILIVEKGPTTRASKNRVGSIEVVSRSQFNMVQAEVERLQRSAAPPPLPALPDNKQLKADLVKGSASLTETMQAMQVTARVQAAEAGLARMAGLLAQLAASGALPDSFAAQLEDAKTEMEVLTLDLKEEARSSGKGPSTGGRKSVAIDAVSKKSQTVSEAGTKAGTGTKTGTSTAMGSRPSSGIDKQRASVISLAAIPRASYAASGRLIAVTRNEMDDAIQSLRDDMMKSMQTMTYRAASSAETAAGTAKGISDKMDIALKLNSRISDLYALTSDYAEQLSGFDAGLTTQMQSFQEQMMQMRDDLKAGLIHLETVNNNAETAAVIELTERYSGLQNDMEANLAEHQRLTTFQKQLGDELRGLMEVAEQLKEQKADRDEVWDGLRDKADLSKLSGLLTEEHFASSRADLDARLDLCYNKFYKQESVWMTVMKDLSEVIEDKAEITQLLSIKDDAQRQLRELQDLLRLLNLQLGEPRAAILTRLLSKDGACGACQVPALMEAAERCAGQPHALPALRPPPDGRPCEPAFATVVVEDENTKTHVCNRWVGGSHTLVPRAAPREPAPREPAPREPAPAPPVSRYDGYGADGKLYKMEEAQQPCVECNKLSTDVAAEEAGAGDTALEVCDCRPRIEVCECWPGVKEKFNQG